MFLKKDLDGASVIDDGETILSVTTRSGTVECVLVHDEEDNERAQVLGSDTAWFDSVRVTGAPRFVPNEFIRLLDADPDYRWGVMVPLAFPEQEAVDDGWTPPSPCEDEMSECECYTPDCCEECEGTGRVVTRPGVPVAAHLRGEIEKGWP